VAAWELVKTRAIDVFRPGALSLLPTLPGWSSLGLPPAGLEGEPVVSLLDALRALALRERNTSSATTVDLVTTLPGTTSSALSTPDVVRTLLESARESILIIGFEINDPSVRKLLFRHGLDGLEITVVGDRQRGPARELLKDWPASARPLRALENVEPASQLQSFLHAKVIVIDSQTALIGSANFTAGGLRNNLEIGVRVSGGAATEIARLMERLAKEGWLINATP
jgi:phosphatidylserine/phosphatidylglycerophosphate/cardiolipin synthase-like enzyme